MGATGVSAAGVGATGVSASGNGADGPVASRLRRFGLALYRQTLAEPVRDGRLRDLDWPYGLRAIVVAGYLMFAVAALTVMTSGPIREAGPLLLNQTGVGLPELMVWPLVLLLSFGSASLLTAAAHGPWWLRLLGLVFALMIMGTWSLRRPGSAGWAAWPYLAAGLMLAVVVLVAVRWRRRFAWWELVVFWLLIGGAMTIGLAETRFAKAYGSDLTPLLLQQTAATLGFLALPAALVAGAAVAEVTVRATVSATQSAQRLTSRGWPYAILALVLAVRVIQAVGQVSGRDPVTQGWAALLWAAALIALLGGVGSVLVRIGRTRGAHPAPSAVGEELGRIGFAVAASLILVTLPVQIGLAVLQIVASLDPGSAATRFSVNVVPLVGQVVDPSRAVIGAVLLGLAVRAARRGQATRALVTGCVGVMLIALARRLLFGDRIPAPIDPDVLNLLVSALVVIALATAVLRRRLDRRRACAYAGLLILSALVSYRDFISDPVGALLGFSGAALVLFGLTWDLLTGSGWGNGDSRRFPRPTRVLLVLTNSVLTMTVLAYAALVRDGSTTIYLDPYAQVGDVIFGTALLAAAVIAVVDSARSGRPVE